MRVVDQALPAGRRARLLEVDAHRDAAGRRAAASAPRGEALGVLERGVGVVHAARPDDDEQAVVARGRGSRRRRRGRRSTTACSRSSPSGSSSSICAGRRERDDLARCAGRGPGLIAPAPSSRSTILLLSLSKAEIVLSESVRADVHGCRGTASGGVEIGRCGGRRAAGRLAKSPVVEVARRLERAPAGRWCCEGRAVRFSCKTL